MFNILFIGLLSVQTATSPASGSGIDVLYYQVSVTPDLATRSVQGSERIEFRVLTPLIDVDFDCGDLKIGTVTDGKSELRFAVVNHRLRVRWPAVLRAGTR